MNKQLNVRISMLRQWLNEDRITDPNKMVTNDDILVWLGTIVEQAKEEERNNLKNEIKTQGFDGVTSGKKMAKKLRQIYKRELDDLAADRTDKLFKTFEEHIRPKPQWIPAPVWKVIQRAVLIHYVLQPQMRYYNVYRSTERG